MTTRIGVNRRDLADVGASTMEPAALGEGEVRLRVDVFGLSSNNISYALFGDALGYWAYFPVDETHGCVPVWGFADVIESRCDSVAVETRVFGYLPMADEIVVMPDAVDALTFSDAAPHRVGLHPWYNRYYRCDADPVYAESHEQLQVSLWALFMTGWALAAELAQTMKTVVVSSASSKTSMALAWTLRELGVPVVGVTSPGNVDFVEASGLYDTVLTYDDLNLDAIEAPASFVDVSGSPLIKERVHAAAGDRLVDSVVLGATHQGAGAATGAPTGPEPRFFFIPDVAERVAAESSHADFHQSFADAWHRFAAWIEDRVQIDSGQGVAAVLDAYDVVRSGGLPADTAKVLSW